MLQPNDEDKLEVHVEHRTAATSMDLLGSGKARDNNKADDALLSHQNLMDNVFHNLNLSVMSCQGEEVGSEHGSRFGLSVNQVHIPEDAPSEEKQIHNFLDMCGIFEINVKMQMQDDQKSDLSFSPDSKRYRAELVNKNNLQESFLAKRSQRLANK